MGAVIHADGLPGPAAELAFAILTPIWQRWWFLLLVALAIAALAAGLYRYRVRRLLEVANLRTQIAADLHDDIGANLTRISVLSEVARRHVGAPGTQPDRELAAIADLARESIASLGEIVWAIHPGRDRVRDLTRKMREYAEDLIARRDIELGFRAPGEDHERRIDVALRRDLFLVFKEAVSNAARHSACSRIQIELRVDGPGLSLEVRDNGAGFDPEMPRAGNGLTNMRRRAQRLGADFMVASRSGEGTLVRLDLHLGSALRRRAAGAGPNRTRW